MDCCKVCTFLSKSECFTKDVLHLKSLPSLHFYVAYIEVKFYEPLDKNRFNLQINQCFLFLSNH